MSKINQFMAYIGWLTVVNGLWLYMCNNAARDACKEDPSAFGAYGVLWMLGLPVALLVALGLCWLFGRQAKPEGEARP